MPRDKRCRPYRGGGVRRPVPVRRTRPWIMLRIKYFRAAVGEFLDYLESIRQDPLTERALYLYLEDLVRWVATVPCPS